MPKIALDGAAIADSVASGHIDYEVYKITGYTPTYPIYDDDGNYIGTGGGDPIWGWVGGYNTSATISGTCKSTVTNVKIEGKSPIVSGDRTSENDSYTLPEGRYVGGSHSNAQGSVTGGNSKNVFINGKSVSVNGSSVNTHAGTSTSINGGVSNSVNIGG